MENAVLAPKKEIDPKEIFAFARSLAGWADDKKAENIYLYKAEEGCSYADYILVCSGNSDRHVFAIAEELRDRGKQSGHRPLGVEGLQQAQWVLLDFGDVIAHVFYEPVREYYDIDRLWPAEARIWVGGAGPKEDEDDDEDGDLENSESAEDDA